uniref:Resolvase/invertase-type recombinase catalytic domain-containing protein n=1 Tax=viral metagenome TaxID=1070528 RepID=A0A6C0LXY4_9ZZZZ
MTAVANVVGYVRVSSQQQSQFSEGHVSLAVQERAIRDWCTANGMNLVRMFQDVVSARDMTKQKSLQELGTFVRSGTIKTVVVYNVSRFSRNVLQGLEFIKNRLLARGVNIHSVMDGCQYSGTAGKNMFTMTMAFGENQSNVISDNVKSSHTFLRGFGFQFGAAKYGMKAIRVPSSGDPNILVRKFVRDDDEHAVIETIMHSGLSAEDTALNLNGQGVLRRGKPWTEASVRGIIVAHKPLSMRQLQSALPSGGVPLPRSTGAVRPRHGRRLRGTPF